MSERERNGGRKGVGIKRGDEKRSKFESPYCEILCTLMGVRNVRLGVLILWEYMY